MATHTRRRKARCKCVNTGHHTLREDPSIAAVPQTCCGQRGIINTNSVPNASSTSCVQAGTHHHKEGSTVVPPNHTGLEKQGTKLVDSSQSNAGSHTSWDHQGRNNTTIHPKAQLRGQAEIAELIGTTLRTGMMSDSKPHQFDSNTVSLIEGLIATEAEITWAQDVISIFKLMKEVYNYYGKYPSYLQGQTLILEIKVKELEKYMAIDIERHIALGIGRPPFYVSPLSVLLTQSLEHIENFLAFDEKVNSADLKEFDHLSAEFQALFMEHGFCNSVGILFNVEEAARKLEILSLRARTIERETTQSPNKAGSTIADLHDILATQHGIHQALMDKTMGKVKDQYDELSHKLNQLEHNICGQNLKIASDVFQAYLVSQRSLKKPFLSELYNCDPLPIINGHSMHPGTRIWLIEMVQRWAQDPNKSLFYLSGRQATGKTAFSSALAKQYSNCVAACYFFDANDGDGKRNSINGLLQSIALQLCHNNPTYFTHLEKQFENNPEIKTKLWGPWRDLYELLLNEPLSKMTTQRLMSPRRTKPGEWSPFGKVQIQGQRPSFQNKIIIVDGLDECDAKNWRDMKELLERLTNDLPPSLCLFVTCRSRCFGQIVPVDVDKAEGLKFGDRSWVHRHIKDIEIYLSCCLGAILSGEDEGDAPNRAKADEMTLQDTTDQLLKCSAGRFDYAIHVMESFAAEMGKTGQFLSSVKKAMQPMRRNHGGEFEGRMSEFQGVFRSYRDKEGRSICVRVMRQSQYLMDKFRVALIRGRHNMANAH